MFFCGKQFNTFDFCFEAHTYLPKLPNIAQNDSLYKQNMIIFTFVIYFPTQIVLLIAMKPCKTRKG